MKKIIDLIKPTNNNSNHYDEKYLKSDLNSNKFAFEIKHWS